MLESIYHLDIYINNLLSNQNSEVFILLMNIITNIFNPLPLALISLVCILYYLYKRNYYRSSLLIFCIGGSYFFTFIIKNLIMRIRPLNPLIAETGYSFPSAHAVVSTVFFSLIIYLFVFKIKSPLIKYTSLFLCSIMILAVSFSRLYLGVHWLSDVVSGIVLGIIWVVLVVLVKKIFSGHYAWLRKS